MPRLDGAEASDDSVKAMWPFNVVDAFAYLGQGYFTLVWAYVAFVADNPATTTIPKRYPLLVEPMVAGPLVLIVAYVVGHVLAAFAREVLENGLAIGLLGAPQRHALSDQESTKWRQRLTWVLGSPDYSNQHSPAVRTGFAVAYRAFSSTDCDPASVVKICAPVVRARSSSARARLASFLNLYTFSRNLAFTMFVLGVITFFTTMIWKTTVGTLLIGVSVVLVGRYLTFYRLYSDEVLLAFSGLAKSERPHP